MQLRYLFKMYIFSHMSNEVKKVKCSFCWRDSAFNIMLQITSGKLMKYVSLPIPSQHRNMAACCKKNVCEQSAYKSKEEMHKKSYRLAFWTVKTKKFW